MLLYDEDEESGTMMSPMFVGSQVDAMNDSSSSKNLIQEYGSVQMLRRISRSPDPVDENVDFTMKPDVNFYVDRKKDGLKPKFRPHVMHLIDGQNYETPEQLANDEEEVIKYMPGYNFGWIEGVFIRCTLSIFGVLMFLRLNWMFAQAGVWGALGVIAWSVCLTSLTTSSLSALSTNGMVKGGGVYYMVSRSLGAEYGGVVAITLFLAQSAAVSLHLRGFGEAVAILEDGRYVFSHDGDCIFFGCLALVAVLGAAFLGANFEVQSQKVLAVSMALALVMFYFGVFFAKHDDDIGSTPMSPKTFADNVPAHYTAGQNWLTVFGVFFPACTGISAGSSISGDLKDPQEAIPKGTFAAIGLTTVIYVSMGLFMCAVFTPEGLGNITTQISAIDISLVAELMYLGMFAAALSSALALIVGAPRVLMAVARDDIVPQLKFFKTSYFSAEEPLRGYITVVVIAFICITCLDLNTVSPIVTNFYLVQYGLMNYSVYHAHISKAPGWRPSFKYWSPYSAMLGAIMCFISMFMVNWAMALVTIIASIALFKYIVYLRPDVNWGDSGVAKCQKSAVESIYRMERLKDHVKNYRPQFLLLCKNPASDTAMISLMTRLKKARAISIVGRVIIGDINDITIFRECENARKDVIMVKNDIAAILQVVSAPSLLSGVQSLLQLAGFGKLKPNTVLLGFKTKWLTESKEELLEYIDILRACFATSHAVCILRNSHEPLKFIPHEAEVVINTGENLYCTPAERGHIDVWWLVEDGGLPFLLAFLMSRHSEYRKSGTVLRLFGLISVNAKDEDVALERLRLQVLMSRFRFDAEVILVTQDSPIAPENEKRFREMSGETEPLSVMSIEVLNIHHHMRELSAHAHVIVVSLPVPKTTYNIKTYLTYLDLLSDSGRPTFIARGNQQTVLSYHS